MDAKVITSIFQYQELSLWMRLAHTVKSCVQCLEQKMYLGGEEKENNCSLGGGGEKENNNYGWGEERRRTIVIFGRGGG